MVTMFFRAKKKNEATCKKSHGQEHKMNAWKGMGYFVILKRSRILGQMKIKPKPRWMFIQATQLSKCPL
jgi:hypothetical protein